MILFTWLLLITPIQHEQLFDVFVSPFLAQNRLTEKEITDYFNQKISPRLQKQGQYICVASEKDQIIGCVIFEQWEDNSYYIAEMAVLPKYQRRGIGTKLVFSVFEKDPNAEKIVLITEKDNIWSQAFYEKIGFQKSSFEHPDYPEGYTGYEFIRSAVSFNNI